MKDIHCHILPGVDDGARDIEMSVKMLHRALDAGVTSIVCTPHARDPYFNYQAMCSAYGELVPHANRLGIQMSMGFEVAYSKLLELGLEEWATRLTFENGADLLLEFDSESGSEMFSEYERTIYALQGMGIRVIIAHPERYRAIQNDIDLAVRFVRMGCDLQVSADYLADGLFGRRRRTAKEILSRHLCRYISSDAHRPEHYQYLPRAMRELPQARLAPPYLGERSILRLLRRALPREFGEGGSCLLVHKMGHTYPDGW